MGEILNYSATSHQEKAKVSKDAFIGGSLRTFHYNDFDTQSPLKIQQQRQVLSLHESYKNQKETIHSQTADALEEENFIHMMKLLSYEKLGIHAEHAKNSDLKNFLQGVVDELIVGNMELAKQIYDTNGQVLLEGLKSILTIEGLQKVLSGIGENFEVLFQGNAYEKGKAFTQLGLISSGVGLGIYIGKKVLKTSIKKQVQSNVIDFPKKGFGKGHVAPTQKSAKILDFKEPITITHEITGYTLAKQLPKTANCGHINLDGILEWSQAGKIDHSWFSQKKGLSPNNFVSNFNTHSPEGYRVNALHLGVKDAIQTIEEQIKTGIPTPIIYVPIGGNVLAPHYATIIGIGKKSNGEKVFKIKDSMSDVIPRDFLTEKELIEALQFNNLKTGNTTKDILLQGFSNISKRYLGGETTIFQIQTPPTHEIKKQMVI